MSAAPSHCSSSAHTPSSDQYFHYQERAPAGPPLKHQQPHSAPDEVNKIRPVDALEDALRRMNFAGTGSSVQMNTGPTSDDKNLVAALDPTFSFKPSGVSSGSQSSSPYPSHAGGDAHKSLDDFRFPASTFDSPIFSDAPYGLPTADASQEQQEFEASILKAPQLHSAARFDSPNMMAYAPKSTTSARSTASPFFHDRPSSKAISIKDPREIPQQHVAPAKPAAAVANKSSSDRTMSPISPKEGLRIIASPKRDAYEIAAEQSRMRAAVGIQPLRSPAAPESEDATQNMSSEQLSRLTQHQLASLIQAERARRDPATRNLSMHSDAFKQAATSAITLHPAPSPVPSAASVQSVHVRSQTAPVAAGPSQNLRRPFDASTASALRLDLPQRGAGLGSYLDASTGSNQSSFAPSTRPSASFQHHSTEADWQKQQLATFLSQDPRTATRAPARDDRHLQTGSHYGFSVGEEAQRSPRDGSAYVSDQSARTKQGAPTGLGGADTQLANIIAALTRQQQQQQQQAMPNVADHGFSVNVDYSRPQMSSFASASSYGSTAGPYSPGLRTPTAFGVTGGDTSADVMTRLQAIRFLHPGVFGSHSDTASTPRGAQRQTPPHLDRNLSSFGPHHPARDNAAGGGADPGTLARFLGAAGLGHGINPVVMDPALQRYLLDHNLPLDGPSPTNKKAKLYKTEKCRSWEKNIHATTPEERCQYGNKCQYAHGDHELRPVERHPKYKTQICTTFWLLGQCAYGRRCCFLHNDIPAGGIPELGDLGTQEALRSILKARLSLVGLGGPSGVSGAVSGQASPSPTYYQSAQSDGRSSADHLSPAAYNPSAHPSVARPDDQLLFGSTFERSAAAREASPFSDRNLEGPLLRPRDRSDSLSVNMAPVPELTPIPPSLPVPSLEHLRGSQRPYVPGTPASGLPMFNGDQHTRALAAVQAAHRQGAYQPSSTSPLQDPVVPPRQKSTNQSYINPWASPKYRSRPGGETIGAIGDRGGSTANSGSDGRTVRGNSIW